MARTREVICMSTFGARFAALVLTLALVAITPMSVFAQASGPPSPANSAGAGTVAPASPGQGTGAAPNPASAAGAPQPAGAGASPAASNAGSAAPSAGTASPSASAPTVRALPTPVGGNTPQQQQEPTSLFAYFLIALAVVWFFAALAGITKLMSRPRGMLPTMMPAQESDRTFLSFIMPFAALLTVAVIVTIWGLIFLETSHASELYPLAIDLFVVCFVMLIATVAALRGGSQPRSEVH
jgi:hypothetical protein